MEPMASPSGFLCGITAIFFGAESSDLRAFMCSKFIATKILFNILRVKMKA